MLEFVNKYSVFLYFVLILSTLLVFWQVRDFDFINFDDSVYVFENQRVLDGLTWNGIQSAFTTAPADGNWLPMTWLSLMLDSQLSGPRLKPGLFHLVNVFWHCANGLLLFAVLKKMTGSLWPSAFVAAAFALHPMHVESVAWVTERKDVLSAFFLLLTLTAYAGYVKRPSVLKYSVSLIVFAMGLMSKPMLVTLPFVLLLLDYWPLNRFEVLRSAKKSDRQMCNTGSFSEKSLSPYYLFIEKIPFFALAAVSSAVTFIVQRQGGAVADVGIFSFQSRIANALLSYVRYIGKMFWPIDLAVLYPFEMAVNIPFWKSILCILLLTGITLAVLWLGRGRKYLPVGWFWFLGTLVPVIGLVHAGPQAYADRYTYIPYIGLFLMIAWGLPEFLSKRSYRRAVLGISMVVVLTAMGLCAYRQTGFWKDSVTLFSHAIEVTKNNYIMHVSLGYSYDVLGRREEAIKAYQQSIRIYPDYLKAYYNLGITYGKLGRNNEAVEACKQAIRIQPDYAEAHNNLGNVYANLGRNQEAIEACKQAIRIKPDCAEAYYNLGNVYAILGRNQDAIEACKQSIRIKPDCAEAHYNLGVAYGNLGLHQEAIEAYRQTIRIRPDYAEAHNNLGNVYAILGRNQEAIEACKQSIRIKPDCAEAHYNLGIAYGNLGRNQEAIEACKQSIRIRPDYAEAHNNLGIAYGNLGRWQEAIEAYRQAIRIKPDFAKAYYNLGIAYSKLDRRQEAIDSARRACELTDYRNAAFLSTLAMTYWSAGKTQEAAQTAQAALKIDPNLADAYGILGSVLSSEGSYEKAVVHLKRLLEIEPNNIIAKNNLAWIFAANPDPGIRNPSEAIRLAQEACTSAKEMDPGLFDTLAAAYACGGRFTEAVQTAQKAIGLAEAAKQIETKTAIERRLNLYQQNQPYVESANEGVDAARKP
jgi:tetratricopeptide (TPR) repeat protein